MVQAAAIKKKYTYEDYLKTPDDKRYELIEGELYMTPSPNTRHQKISRELEFRLMKFVKEKGLGEVFDAPFDVYLDEENVVQPDILFVSNDRLEIIGEDNIKGAPDLVIEILSENTAYRDTIQKKMLYARFGVKEYWIVAPKEEIIEVYVLRERDYTLSCTYHKEDVAASRVIDGFKVELREIF